MGANNKINLKKCGEIVVDLNTKSSKNKKFIFYCTFCNIKCDQLQKFSLHIDEHLDSSEDVLKEAVIKCEVESEQIGIQSFPNIEQQDILNPITSNYQSEEFLIREIKQEKETINETTSAVCDKEEFVYSTLYYDSEPEVVNTTNDERNHYNSYDVHHRKKLKLKDNIEEMDYDNSKDVYNDQLLVQNFPEESLEFIDISEQTDTSYSRKNVSGRKVRDLENCRKRCKEKIFKEEQQYIFNKYWSCGSYNERQLFVANLIDVEGTQSHSSKIRPRLHTYKYYLELPNRTIPVCQKCFRYTLCEGEQFIKTTMRKKIAGTLLNLQT